MIDALYCLAFVGGAVALSFATYLVARRLAGPDVSYERHRDMASAMVTRISALHGLILALVFAQEMASYQRLDVQTAQEASAIADVFNDAARYDATALAPVRSDIVEYLRIIVDDEWRRLGDTGDLDPKAWEAWERVYEAVLDLTPQAPRQTSLRDHMLTALHAISAARDIRDHESGNALASLFWLAALSGVVLIAAGHYIYDPKRHNLVLLGLFSAYSGVILFLIFAFTNPYRAPAALSPQPLVQLLAELSIEVTGATTGGQ